jgi:hypothetical protein
MANFHTLNEIPEFSQWAEEREREQTAMNFPHTLGPSGRLRPNWLGMPVASILLENHVFTPRVGSTAVTLTIIISLEGRETLLGIHDQVHRARVRPAMTHPPLFQLG